MAVVKTVLNSNGENRHSRVVLHLGGKASRFSQFNRMLTRGLSCVALIVLQYVPSKPMFMMLHFIRCLLCFCWGNRVILILHFVYGMCHISAFHFQFGDLAGKVYFFVLRYIYFHLKADFKREERQREGFHPWVHFVRLGSKKFFQFFQQSLAMWSFLIFSGKPLWLRSVYCFLFSCLSCPWKREAKRKKKGRASTEGSSMLDQTRWHYWPWSETRRGGLKVPWWATTPQVHREGYPRKKWNKKDEVFRPKVGSADPRMSLFQRVSPGKAHLFTGRSASRDQCESSVTKKVARSI